MSNRGTLLSWPASFIPCTLGDKSTDSNALLIWQHRTVFFIRLEFGGRLKLPSSSSASSAAREKKPRKNNGVAGFAGGRKGPFFLQSTSGGVGRPQLESQRHFFAEDE